MRMRTGAAAILGLGGAIAMLVGLEVPILSGLANLRPGEMVGMRMFMWGGGWEPLSVAVTIGAATTFLVTAAALRLVRYRRWAVLFSLITIALGGAAFFFLTYNVDSGFDATYQEFVDLTVAVFSEAHEGLSRPIFFAGAGANLLGLAIMNGPRRLVKADEPRTPFA